MNEDNINSFQRSSLWHDAFRRLRRRKFAMVCFWIVAGYFALAVFVYIAESIDPTMSAINWKEQLGQGMEYQRPSLCSVKTIFGTNFLGQSTLISTLYGVKTALAVAFAASVISIMIGVPLGAAAGYFGGVVDDIVVWIYSTLSNIPWIILVMAFAVVLNDDKIMGGKLSGEPGVYLAIGLTSWVGICRLIRGEIIKRKESEYVLAAKAVGCSNSRIIFRHLLPNVFHIIIINFSLRFVSFIHMEVIISFLGLGDANKPSWGKMISAASSELTRGIWWEMTAATMAIFVLSLALNIFGDALRDCLDPKLRMER
nr:ABC transporter permease [Anaerohalosphaera sp.]